MSKTLMIQGTTSDAGKSTVVSGICRWLHRQGISVAPFKPQNMALNSAVTEDGGEIGRAQAVQAQACGLPARIDFNPVLIKPTTDSTAQIIVHGHPVTHLDAKDYHQYKTTAMTAVLESHERLTKQFQCIIVEGAGSPAEINLRDRDIANMGFAEAVDCPVILVADIDRGGVFAHLVGTLELLSASEQQRVKGFIINRFRGDLSLLQPGLDWLEQRTGKPVIGVLPYLQGLHIEAEDALPRVKTSAQDDQLRIIVPALPRISNHNDFDALRLHPDVHLQFIGPEETIPAADLIILPGSKAVRDDYQWLVHQGWKPAIEKHLRYGGKLMGICGGFQMLGTAIHDPCGIEGNAGSSPMLGLLDFDTALRDTKTLSQRTGILHIANSVVTGYEIHAGESSGPALNTPFATLNDAGPDGVISHDAQIMGTYLHGVFDHPDAMTALLNWAGRSETKTLDYAQLKETQINRLADAIHTHLDKKLLMHLLAV